MAGYGVLI